MIFVHQEGIVQGIRRVVQNPIYMSNAGRILNAQKTKINVKIMSKSTSVIKVLDKGFVQLLGVLGDELTVVNSARASFGKEKQVLDESDKKLITYLAKHKHFSPFRHVIFQFRLKMPEFVARQTYKHAIGVEATSSYPTKDHAWNELSRRYIEIEDYYIPSQWRLQSADNKQASQVDKNGNPICIDSTKYDIATGMYKNCLDVIKSTIDYLIHQGVAKEQAQILLPISFYTEVVWTASFQAIMNFLDLRDALDAQWEIREYAKALSQFVQEQTPILFEAWMEAKK